MTENDDGDSVDTTDMSAIPSDRFEIGGGNNIETEDEDPDFGDDFQDNFDPTGLEEEEEMKSVNESSRKSYSKKARQSSIDKKTNRRVSFGEGTKPEIEEEDTEDEVAENDDVIDNSGEKNNKTERKETIKSRKSISPLRSHTTPARSGANSSSGSSSSSSGGMYSMGTTPGSNEFAR